MLLAIVHSTLSPSPDPLYTAFSLRHGSVFPCSTTRLWPCWEFDVCKIPGNFPEAMNSPPPPDTSTHIKIAFPRFLLVYFSVSDPANLKKEKAEKALIWNRITGERATKHLQSMEKPFNLRTGEKHKRHGKCSRFIYISRTTTSFFLFLLVFIKMDFACVHKALRFHVAIKRSQRVAFFSSSLIHISLGFSFSSTLRTTGSCLSMMAFLVDTQAIHDT